MATESCPVPPPVGSFLCFGWVVSFVVCRYVDALLCCTAGGRECAERCLCCLEICRWAASCAGLGSSGHHGMILLQSSTCYAQQLLSQQLFSSSSADPSPVHPSQQAASWRSQLPVPHCFSSSTLGCLWLQGAAARRCFPADHTGQSWPAPSTAA